MSVFRPLKMFPKAVWPGGSVGFLPGPAGWRETRFSRKFLLARSIENLFRAAWAQLLGELGIAPLGLPQNALPVGNKNIEIPKSLLSKNVGCARLEVLQAFPVAWGAMF